MNRQMAWEELNLRVRSASILSHSLAVEAIMRAIARVFDENEEQWGIAGLLHDIEAERVKDHPGLDTTIAADILGNMEIDPVIVYAILSNNFENSASRRRNIDKALFVSNACAEIITSSVLATTGKKLDCISVEYLTSMHKSASNGNIARVETCELLGMSVEETYGLALSAMSEIKEVLCI